MAYRIQSTAPSRVNLDESTILFAANFLMPGMSPKTMKKAHGGAATLPGAGLEPYQTTQVRGVEPNKVPMAEISPPDHVIHIQDHESSKEEGLAQRVINKLDFLRPREFLNEVPSDKESAMQSAGENLLTFVADPSILDDFGAHRKGDNNEENEGDEESDSDGE